MSLSNFLENALLNWAFNTTAMPTRPTAWYAAVHVADPTDDGTVGELIVSNDSGFVRKAITFGASSGGQSLSLGAVSWTPSTGSFVITHVSIWDALTGGNCLIYGELVVPKTITNASPLVLAIGDVVAVLD